MRLRFESLEERLAPATLPADFTETIVASGAPTATAMELSSDGKLFLAEKRGTMEVWSNAARLEENFFRDAPIAVRTEGESGLLGVALDPDYATNRFVYVYYTTTSADSHNRVSRFTASDSSDIALAASEMVLLELDPHSSRNHHGGALHFGPDGKLYIATGDNGDSDNSTGTHNSQRLTSLHGKILRIDSDGAIPADNPFIGQTEGKYQAIWALGLRNPFTFSFDSRPGGGGSGRMFINDVGQAAWEEINAGAAGANFGWPATEGDFDQDSHPTFQRPFYAYHHDGDVTTPSGCAITGGAFYNPAENQFGVEYESDYFFADYCGGWIHRIDPETRTVTLFASGIPAPVDLKVDSAGNLYYLARDSGQVFRVSRSGDSQPAITEQPADRVVSIGQVAAFTVGASGGALHYQWQRADSSAPNEFADIEGARSRRLSLAGVSLDDDQDRFRAIVSNSHGAATTGAATLTVIANLPPLPTIVSPRSRTTWRGGDTIHLAGAAADSEDGALPESQLSWEIRFYHDDGHRHHHPFQEFSGVGSADITIPDVGETSPNVWYRILLTARDSHGAEVTVKRDIHPRTVTITLESAPLGAELTLDGAPAPAAFEAVVGMRRRLGAALARSIDGVDYEFVSWSDGGDAVHEIVTPAVDTVYSAAYGRPPPPRLLAEYFDFASPHAALPDLTGLAPDVVRTEKRVLYRSIAGNWPNLDDRFADTFAARLSGALKIDAAGEYRFFLTSDEGSRLWIDGQLLIDNDGVHRTRERSATISLSTGYHSVRIEYFENDGPATLVLGWEGPGIDRQVVPATRLFRSLPAV